VDALGSAYKVVMLKYSSHFAFPKLTGLSFIFAGLFTSCMTTDPYTGEQRVSKTAAGAGLGAAGGAILGAVIGNNTGDGDAGRGALIGAAVGGLAGGGIGVYMDKQEAEIRAQLQGSGVSVTRVGNNIILNMPHDITFDVAKDYLRPEFTGTLDAVAVVLNKFPETIITVNGHTDSDGSSEANQSLSERRASSVSRYLSSRGVSLARLQAQGFGESAPIAPNTDAAGKARNRRVELHIIPNQ
jgi:outer membrane protein OmpA-like peptidoglycan-associated protein